MAKSDTRCPSEAVPSTNATSFFIHDYLPRPSLQILPGEFKNIDGKEVFEDYLAIPTSTVVRSGTFIDLSSNKLTQTCVSVYIRYLYN